MVVQPLHSPFKGINVILCIWIPTYSSEFKCLSNVGCFVNVICCRVESAFKKAKCSSILKCSDVDMLWL